MNVKLILTLGVVSAATVVSSSAFASVVPGSTNISYSYGKCCESFTCPNGEVNTSQYNGSFSGKGVSKGKICFGLSDLKGAGNYTDDQFQAACTALISHIGTTTLETTIWKMFTTEIKCNLPITPSTDL